MVLLAQGCRRESEIAVYQVPKESSSEPVAAADPHAGMAMPGGGDPHAGMPPGGEELIQPGVSGEVPDHWKLAGGSKMRIASYRVDGDDGKALDISLVALAGDAGGTLDNINRWRAQVGLEEVDEAGLAAGSRKLKTPVGEAVVADLEGSERIIAAVIPLSSETWFYKLRGDPGLAGREKDAFLRWIETAEVKVEIPADEPAVKSPHGGGPPADIAWTVPEGWTEKPGDSLRAGIFATAGGAEVTVSRLGGDGGGDLANVNRWRGQIGLGPLETLEGAAEPIEPPAGSMPLVAMEGTDQGTVAAWTRRGEVSWFFKLTGPKDVVAAQREAFVSFVKSTRFERP